MHMTCFAGWCAAQNCRLKSWITIVGIAAPQACDETVRWIISLDFHPVSFGSILFMLNRLKEWARHLKKETYALYFAYRDPRVPWYAKLLVAFVVAHTLSPIDLIPDFIPVIGYLDDLIITPLGLALALRLIPAEVMAEARNKVESGSIDGNKISRVGALIVISIWLIGLLLVVLILFRYFRDQ